MFKGALIKFLSILYLILFFTTINRPKIDYGSVLFYLVFGSVFIVSRFFCLDCKRFNIRYNVEKYREDYGNSFEIYTRCCKRCKWKQRYKTVDSFAFLFDGRWINDTNKFNPRSHYSAY